MSTIVELIALTEELSGQCAGHANCLQIAQLHNIDRQHFLAFTVALGHKCSRMDDHAVTAALAMQVGMEWAHRHPRPSVPDTIPES